MSNDFEIPALLSSTISNLNFLGRTSKNEKLYFADRTHIKPYNVWARIKRAYYSQENLETQTRLIKDIVSSGSNCIKTYRENIYFIYLITAFAQAREGLVNLKDTYIMEGTPTDELSLIIFGMRKQLEELGADILREAKVNLEEMHC